VDSGQWSVRGARERLTLSHALTPLPNPHLHL
jgi:hypothetical protein